MKSALRGAFLFLFLCQEKAFFMDELVTLAEAKQQLRVLHSREDDLISLFIKAALDNVLHFIDRPLDEDLLEKDGALPASLKAAVLLIVSDLYANREAQQATDLKINQTCIRLMWPYKRMGL
jgi:uncharacterized phage protein (predicted DNA packaging)